MTTNETTGPVIERITRYAVTHVGTAGFRRLTYPNQGRFHKATMEEAAELAKVISESNTPKRITEAYGEQAVGTFEARAIQCYANGDAVSIWQ